MPRSGSVTPCQVASAASAISNIKFDKIVVWDSQNGAATSGFLQGLARSLPPMFDVLNQLTSIRMPGADGAGEQVVPLSDVPVDLVRTGDGGKKTQ